MTVVTPKVRYRRTFFYVVIMSGMMGALVVAAGFVSKSLKVGLSIPQALQHAWLPIAAAVLALFAIWGLYVLIVERPTAATPDVVDAGRTRWKRIRLFSTIVAVPGIIVFTAGLLYGLTRGQWEAQNWVLVVWLCLMVIGLVSYWVSPPKREQLYALGTGDTTRVNDEREQMISGKAAFTTFLIVIILVGLGGSLYEAFITGNIPWRANIAVGMIFLTYQVSRWYWARKL